MTIFQPKLPHNPAPVRGASEYRCAACGQRIGVVKRGTDRTDEEAVARFKKLGQWNCHSCGGTSLERASQ